MRNPYAINIVLSSILLSLVLFDVLVYYTEQDTCTVCPICNPEVKEAYLEEQATLDEMGYIVGYPYDY